MFQPFHNNQDASIEFANELAHDGMKAVVLGNAALHRIFYLVAERSVGQIDEDTAILRAERVGECLRGWDVAWRGRAEIELGRLRAGF